MVIGVPSNSTSSIFTTTPKEPEVLSGIGSFALGVDIETWRAKTTVLPLGESCQDRELPWATTFCIPEAMSIRSRSPFGRFSRSTGTPLSSTLAVISSPLGTLGQAAEAIVGFAVQSPSRSAFHRREARDKGGAPHPPREKDARVHPLPNQPHGWFVAVIDACLRPRPT